MPTFSNENLPNGGSFANVQVGAGIEPDSAIRSTWRKMMPTIVAEDTAVISCRTSVLAQRYWPQRCGRSKRRGARHVGVCMAIGSVICANGTFTYTPNADLLRT